MAPVVKNMSVNAEDMRFRSGPWVGKVPWRRSQQPAPVLMPGESHRQRILAGYSSCGRKEWDTTEVTYHAHI